MVLIRPLNLYIMPKFIIITDIYFLFGMMKFQGEFRVKCLNEIKSNFILNF